MKRFTLLELMIVIAVLGILTTILLPSLSNTRGAGRRAVCISNQKQILTALTSYVVQNNTYFPQTILGFGSLDKLSWDDYLAMGNYDGRSLPWSQIRQGTYSNYYGGNELYRCPEDHPNEDLQYRSYGITQSGSNRGVLGYSNSNEPDSFNSSLSINKVTMPSETIIMTESYSSAPDGGRFYRKLDVRRSNWNELGSTNGQAGGIDQVQPELKFNNVQRHFRRNFSIFGFADTSVRFLSFESTAGDSGKYMLGANNSQNTYFDATR